MTVLFVCPSVYLSVCLSVSVCLRHVKGPAVLHVLPKLSLGRALWHHKQKAGCIYVNNADLGMQLCTLTSTIPWDWLTLVLVHTTTLSLVLTFFY